MRSKLQFLDPLLIDIPLIQATDNYISPVPLSKISEKSRIIQFLTSYLENEYSQVRLMFCLKRPFVITNIFKLAMSTDAVYIFQKR